ncbi:hypothetical protein FEM08_22070 [Flavobacterium gilvum]|nr:hypothetical protein FEM08_22070 [Flavobacterium gilvum]
MGKLTISVLFFFVLVSKIFRSSISYEVSDPLKRRSSITFTDTFWTLTETLRFKSTALVLNKNLNSVVVSISSIISFTVVFSLFKEIFVFWEYDSFACITKLAVTKNNSDNFIFKSNFKHAGNNPLAFGGFFIILEC